MSKKPSILSSRLHRDSEVQASSTFERPHYVDKLFEPSGVQVTKGSESVDIDENKNITTIVSNDIDRNIDRNNSINVDKIVVNDVDENIVTDITRNISDDVNVCDHINIDENIVNDINVSNNISNNKIIIISKKKDDRDKLKRVSYYLKPSTDKLIAHNAKLAGLGKSEFLQGLLDKAFEKLEIQD